MLNEARVATRLPAQDLERARAFYAEKLGLEPVEERPAWFRDSEEKLLGIGQAVRERQGR
jgi:catechol 2,3-dioxygenase-like lactoylglutathione lyase family enzyme